MNILGLSVLTLAACNAKGLEHVFINQLSYCALTYIIFALTALRCNRKLNPLYICVTSLLHCVSKNVPLLACYNFDTHERILIFFCRNVTDNAGNQKMV